MKKEMSKLNSLKKTNVVLLTIFILIGITLHLLITPVFAQSASPWFVPSPQEHEVALEECKNNGNCGLEATVQAITTAIINSLGEGSGPSPATASKEGAVYFAGGIIIKLITYPPISSGDFVQYIARKMNPVQPAYAQGGTGYQALSALIDLWTAMRNVAYLAFVVIFIVIGFMIMFRAQINPQTVINVQNALPNLVVTLILITFSYAIAGLMVDLIYLGIFLAVSVFSTQGLISQPVAVRDTLIHENLFSAAAEAGFLNHSRNVADAIQAIFNSIVFESWMQAVYNIVTVKGFFVALIIKIAVLFSLFKLFFQLLIAYINIIISTILSPILILFNAIPGSQSFSSWVRNFLSNVLIFPAVAFLFLMSAVLIGGQSRWGVTTGLVQSGTSWTPPFILGAPNQPITVQDVVSVIGLGFILFAPQMVSLLQQTLKTKPLPTAGIFAPVAAGARIAYTPVTAPIRAGAGAVRTYFAEKVERAAWPRIRQGE